VVWWQVCVSWRFDFLHDLLNGFKVGVSPERLGRLLLVGRLWGLILLLRCYIIRMTAERLLGCLILLFRVATERLLSPK